MNAVLGFLRFWYDFVVGDDWRVAAAVVAALALTAVLAGQGLAWIILPLVVLAFLGLSVWRVARRSR
ncbi:hypothetical protein GCM10022631_34990 [Deinococcus rubellus]|uniref:Uncharacterized protein n=1 Tax=Deinococcus rubellus TaxID=1889240 RepID=A0ABY5YFD6_9DEIO|nr:hypothetical protein [Deinococcus rubellus]UWX63550.1 hypothetical protein N0D28_12500 [Deinococcus rubellus]